MTPRKMSARCSLKSQRKSGGQLGSTFPTVVFNDEVSIFSARVRTSLHQCSSVFPSMGLSPFDAKLEKSSRSSKDTSVFQAVSSPSIFETRKFKNKKIGKKMFF